MLNALTLQSLVLLHLDLLPLAKNLVSSRFKRGHLKVKICLGDDGWMPCKNDPEIRCFGILHVPEISNPIISGGVAGIQYLQQTIKTLSGQE